VLVIDHLGLQQPFHPPPPAELFHLFTTQDTRSLSEKSWRLEKVGWLPHNAPVFRRLREPTSPKSAPKWDRRSVGCTRSALFRQAPSSPAGGLLEDQVGRAALQKARIMSTASPLLVSGLPPVESGCAGLRQKRFSRKRPRSPSGYSHKVALPATIVWT
jgi:hypothetical protein